MNSATLICGPTGSGKSNFAHLLARKNSGEIVNIDSRQVYREIPIITASPPESYQAELPHHLYNFLPVEEEFSIAKYCELTAPVIKNISSRGRLPIIVGGTGMYINSLLFGYNEIPSIPAEVRKATKELHEKLGQEEFYRRLILLDREAASLIKPQDPQRSQRAYEVFTATGKSIFDFRSHSNIKPLPEFNFKVICLLPERKFLYEMCNKRLEGMFKEGAIEEVTAIKERLAGSHALKSVGAQEILDFLDNKISLEEAIALAQNRTRQYAKRQITWFKHQIPEKTILEFASKEEFEKLRI